MSDSISVPASEVGKLLIAAMDTGAIRYVPAPIWEALPLPWRDTLNAHRHEIERRGLATVPAGQA